ncbi:MAG: hypothetical protein AVDCRST_MAG20-1851, partial [uncultured Acidimicrobiales bacterium]
CCCHPAQVSRSATASTARGRRGSRWPRSRTGATGCSGAPIAPCSHGPSPTTRSGAPARARRCGGS